MEKDNIELEKAAAAFNRKYWGEPCILCGKPAYDVGAWIPSREAQKSLKVSVCCEAIFFYGVCRSCAESRTVEVHERAERDALATRDGLIPEQN